MKTFKETKDCYFRPCSNSFLKEENINTIYDLENNKEVKVEHQTIEDNSPLLLIYENKIKKLTNHNNIMGFIIGLLIIILLLF